MGGLPDVVTIMEKKVGVQVCETACFWSHFANRYFFMLSVDFEFNMYSVWRPQTSGVMAEERIGSRAWWSGKCVNVLLELCQNKFHNLFSAN